MSTQRTWNAARTFAWRSLVVVSPLLIGGTTLSAQADSGSKSKGTMTNMRHDSTDMAVRMLAVVSRDEIDAGKLAVGKATRTDVKAYAQRMIDDHTKALHQLGDSAKKGGWTLPDSGMWGANGNMVGNSRGSGSTVGSMGSASDTAKSGMGRRSADSSMQNDEAMKLHAANVAAMKKLKDASATTFDNVYMATQVEGHDALLKALDKHPTSVMSQKGLVAEMRATVQMHLNAARKLQSITSAMKP